MHHRLEKKTPREDSFLNPSFSTTLLDKIYRSIDEGERKSSEMKFYRETTTITTTTTAKKQNRSNVRYNNKSIVEEEQGKRKDKKVGTQQPCFVPTHHHHHGDHDQDVLFFSSTSISSDSSSSGGFSSSDTESIISRASIASCFAPPKPVVKKNSNNEKQAATTRTFDGFCHKSKTEGIEIHDDKALLFKSKLRALKIYNNLKKVKQPISPGGRLSSFFNSLFANAKKSKSSSNRSCYYEEEEEDMKSERKLKSKSFSTCSSASSFSRSCLSKTSSERENMFNGVKRTVRFYPVNVIVDEENRPCGHKCLYEEEKVKLPVLEKSRVMENDLVLKDLPLSINNANDHLQGFKLRSTTTNENDEENEDDAASYASSDLFELDHLAVLGNGRYCEELPVYETTHVSTNRAIANGLVI